MSQKSENGISNDLSELSVEGEQTQEIAKRKRSSRGEESPAKKTKDMIKSSSMSSIVPSRGKGRPRLTKQTKVVVPVVEPFKIDQMAKGRLLAVGMGDAGQLGLGEDVLERKKPQYVKEIEDNVICCAAGGMHNVCVTETGDVLTFGCNDEGALGRKTFEEEESMLAAKVDLKDTQAVFCCAGDSHTAILTEDGDVWLWGTFRDANGRLGMKTGEDKKGEGEKAVLEEPTKLELPTKIVRMASGADHLILLDVQGQVYSLGCAESGQLGRISSHFCQKGGRRGADKVLSAAQIQLRKVCRKIGKVTDLACGQYSSFLITESGVVVGFGLNNCYQMGFRDREIRYAPEVIPVKDKDGNSLTVKKVSSGMHHTMLLTDKGEVYTVGCADYGRLGIGQKDELRESETFLKVKLNQPAISIGTGSCTSYAILKDNSTMAWGMGSNLQLANGSEDDEWEPLKMTGKQIDQKKILCVSGGGQHTLILIEAN